MNSKYSISADSRRWWWTSAAGGAAATAAIAAIVTVPAAVGHAIPDPDRGTGTGASVTSTVTSGTNAQAMAATRYVAGNRPCFMVRARWNIAMDGSQPVCGTIVSQVEGERARNRPFGTPEQRAAACPPPPDIRYV